MIKLNPEFIEDSLLRKEALLEEMENVKSKLVALIEKRINIAAEIGKLKSEFGSAIFKKDKENIQKCIEILEQRLSELRDEVDRLSKRSLEIEGLI